MFSYPPRMFHWYCVVLLVSQLSLVFHVLADDRMCEKVDECSCKFKDTGGVVNLRTLGFEDETPA